MDTTQIGKRIGELRISLRKTAQAMANDLDLTHSTMAAMEYGRSSPTIKTLLKMSELYSVNINWLLRGEEPMFLNSNPPPTAGAVAQPLIDDVLANNKFFREQYPVLLEALRAMSSKFKVTELAGVIDELKASVTYSVTNQPPLSGLAA